MSPGRVEVTAERRRGTVTPVEALALAVVLVPVAVAVVRAAVQHWVPVGDAAYFTVRSRDVGTSHTPLLGAWSSGSAVVGVPVNNLGALQLNLLAPFTKVSAYLGTAAGSALLNGLSLAIAWWAARRLLDPWRLLVAMTATSLLVATLGLSWLIDARQQSAMVLPFYALLWLATALVAGVPSALPVAAAVASLVVQTHFTYAYQTVLIGLVGVAGVAWSIRLGRGRRWRRPLTVAVVVLAVCWVQPLLDQWFGTGNLSRVFGPARSSQSAAGLDAGMRILAGGAFSPPFWGPGSMGAFLRPRLGIGRPGALVVLAVWLGAAGIVARAGRRARSPSAIALGVTAVAALLTGVAAAALIPVSAFGLVPQNYYWVWPLAAFLTIAIVLGGSLVVPARFVPRSATAGVAGRGALAAVALTVLAVAVWPRYPISSVPEDENEARRIGGELRSEMAAAFSADDFPDVVEADLSRAFFGNNYPFVMLAEMQRAGVEFRFPPGHRNLDRFGRSRCAAIGRYPRVFIIAGADPRLDPGSVVLAQAVGITDAELAEYADLQERFGELLRAGEVGVDTNAVVADLDGSTDELAAVLDTPGAPASGLARSLYQWRTWGYVDVPDDQRAAFQRWYDLERRSSSDYQTVVFLPPAPEDDSVSC